MPSSPFAVLGGEQFISLTTFRQSGHPVSTPVWIAQDGDALVVTTPGHSGKVKRLRRDSRVELRPCSRTGVVRNNAAAVLASAEIVANDPARGHQINLLHRKYGYRLRFVLLLERLQHPQQTEWVVIRITP
jgi:PPOX class probable F420-dependent enzyme